MRFCITSGGDNCPGSVVELVSIPEGANIFDWIFDGEIVVPRPVDPI